MMSKERLEEIKDHVIWTTEEGILPRIEDSDLQWLIQQAERVQELEELIDKADSHAVRNGKEIMKLTDEKTRLEIENKRYREAKKQIEEKYEYFQDVPSSVSTGLSMAIEILDKALEGEE